MPSTCGVLHCGNVSGPSSTVVLHLAPNNETQREKWRASCGKDKSWQPKKFFICSNHFNEDSYERDLKNELLHLPTKKILKKNAAPFTYHENHQTVPAASFPASPSISLPFTFLHPHTNNLVNHDSSQVNENEINPVNIPSEIDKLKEELACMKDNLEEYKEKSNEEYKLIQIENNELKKKLKLAEEIIKSQEREMKSMKHEQEYMKKNKKNKTPKLSRAAKIKFIYEALHGALTINQIEILMGHKKFAHWTEEELTLAFTLRYMGKKAYNYVRNTMGIPLPSLSQLHRWASKLNIKPGHLECVYAVLKAVAPCYQDFEKIAVITFDECKVKETYEYNQKQDQVIGPHSQMQVGMIRGLFAKWKMPIYMDFDQKMTKDLLMQMITNLHDAGYMVKACCSDMGGGNQGLLKELGISKEKTYIKHPVVEEENIYFFADVPHCLKLTRNWLLDTGFTLSDGSVVTKEPLENLLKATSSPNNPLEVSSCFKLREAHLKCEKTERQSVRLAAELMSHTNSNALRRYFPEDNSAKQLADIIETVNAWFDIFNSYVLYDIPTKSAYGTHLEIQDKHLDNMYEFMSTMRCTGKTSLQVFQKAILMSITSLKRLRLEMDQKFKKPYLLTHRLNQDLLENFFSQIRTRGGLHDHPSPLEAFYRIRMIILGRNPGIVKANCNTLEKSKKMDDEFITASAMKLLEQDLSNAGEPTICDSDPDEPEEPEAVLEEVNLESAIRQEPASIQEEMEKDGIEYLAGWVAYKHKKETWLGSATREGAKANYSHLPSWVQQLSFGGLMQPSPQWLKKCEEIEAIFKTFHGDDIYKGPNVVQKCIFKVICHDTSIPEQVLKTYILMRTRIRIKYLNAWAYVKKQQEKEQKEMEKQKKLEEKAVKDAEKKKKQEEKTLKDAERKRKQEEKAAEVEIKKRKKEIEKVNKEQEKLRKQQEKLEKTQERKKKQEEERTVKAAQKRKSSEPVQRKLSKKMKKLTT